MTTWEYRTHMGAALLAIIVGIECMVIGLLL